MKLRTHKKNTQIKKKIYVYNFNKIKKKNLDFNIIYSIVGSSETYSETLNYSEIELPKNTSIKIERINILENGKKIRILKNSEAKKMILLLDKNNSYQHLKK